jgi:hypothetical protein
MQARIPELRNRRVSARVDSVNAELRLAEIPSDLKTNANSKAGAQFLDDDHANLRTSLSTSGLVP